MIKLAIFDMDGLMLDTETIAKKTWRQALEFYGHVFDDSFYNTLIGKNSAAARLLMYEHYGENFDLVTIHQMQSALAKKHIETFGITTKKGLLPLLDYLDRVSIKKCIATSTAQDYMQYKMKNLGGVDLLSRFDGYVTGDQVENSKPHPEIFLKAAALVGVAPSDAIVLEDSAAGVAAGASAGMRVFLVPDMVEPDAETVALAFAKCEDLNEVLINIASKMLTKC